MNSSCQHPFTLHGLYAITHESHGDSNRLYTEVHAALDGGARIIQYRDKTDQLTQRHHEAEKIMTLCTDYQVPLIINDDLELAETITASGIHLGQHDTSIAEARARLGNRSIIGVSCYNNPELAEKAAANGADYVAFGSFFASPTKPDAVTANPELLTQWKKRPIPACAIGGITADNASSLVDAGADMIAVISHLWGATDIRQQAKQLSQLYK